MTDVWYLLKDHERYVYHYTRSETLVRYILPTKKLRFSRFKDVNDPRESKSWRFNYTAFPERFSNWTELEADINARIKDTARLACFVRDPPDAAMAGRDEHGAATIQRAYERGHSRPRMWSQYAEDYGGACLVFDRAKLDASVRLEGEKLNAFVHAAAVVYENPPALPELRKPNAFMIQTVDFLRDAQAATNTHINRHWRELFFLKARDWEQEREYRWLLNVSDAQDFFVNIETSLVGILIGDRFPESLKHPVEAFTRETSTQFAEMEWQNGFPQPLPLNWGKPRFSH
jgi:hypothetical protein